MDNSLKYLDHTFCVGSCDIDMWGRLKPTTILSLCQETAYMHSSVAGFGYDRLHALNLSWVLSRVKVEIERLPVWGESIRVRTWHKRESGLFGLRDYIFFDQNDTPIIRVTSSWLIINLATRRVTRMDRVFSDKDAFILISYPHDAIDTEAPKIELIEEVVAAGSHRVVYSDIDLNHHVNNVRYLEWACDNSPQQMMQERLLSGFMINFNHEAKFGECVDIGCEQPNECIIRIKGECCGRNIFTSELSYREDSRVGI